MAHISYWMNAVKASAENCFISFPQLPAIESLRFIQTASAFSENTLYLGSANDLYKILISRFPNRLLNGISFFVSCDSESDPGLLNVLALERKCNLIRSDLDLFTLYECLDQKVQEYRSGTS